MSFLCRLLVAWVLLSASAFAQYRTESWDLIPGWNGIYLNVDPGTEPLDILLASDLDILEVWQWRPGGLNPTIESLAGQGNSGADEWRVWRRDDPLNSTFTVMVPHAAYLIQTNLTRTFSLKGKVVAPKVRWRIDGSNLVGFPIKEGATQTLSAYLAGSGIVDNDTDIFRYTGGDLGQNNPASVPARLVQARRGEAFWIRSTKFSDVYGPVSVEVAFDSGLHFGAAGSLKRVLLRNRTDSEVTVTLEPVDSEPAPGETAVPAQPMLLTRERDADTGFFVYSPLGASTTLTIPAQDSVGLSLSVDRSAMPGQAGDLFASLLRVTDQGGRTEIYLPVTAEKAGLAGLWVGEALITRVQNQLQRFQRDDDGNYRVDPITGRHVPEYEVDSNGLLILDGDGKPIPVTDQELNDTAQEFKLRLVVHVDASGQATLLSRAYAGVISDDGAGNQLTGITTAESLLHPDHLKTAVRLSCSHLPSDLVQGMAGTMNPGAALTTTVVLGANHPSNPFLHTYHPDHDNKDARFANRLPAGLESHTVERAITLTVNNTPGPGEGPEWGTTLLTGTFSETVSGIHKQSIAASGIFAIGKVSEIATLQTP